MTIFKGVGAAMVTPFGADGKIDYNVLERYTEHLIQGGVSALFPFGTTGEPSTVSDEEYVTALKFIVEQVKGRLPVIAGAGSNSTQLACKRAQTAKDCGADGVLVVTPYYNKCTQKGLTEHYKAVAAQGLPVIVYNVPSRTGVDILPETLAELSAIDGIAGIKEAVNGADKFQSAAQVCAQTGLAMYCGDDSLTTIAMALGCKGVISVAANPAPQLMTELCGSCFAGDFEKARALQFKLDRFISCLFSEVNPIPVKKAMQLLGFDVGAPRLPLTELEPVHTDELRSAMKILGLI